MLQRLEQELSLANCQQCVFSVYFIYTSQIFFKNVFMCSFILVRWFKVVGWDSKLRILLKTYHGNNIGTT